MSIEGWKQRFAEGIAKSGKSHREISLVASLNPGYVHSILTEGKEPTVEKLSAVCEAAGLSIYYVLGGFDMTPDTERFIRLLLGADPADRDAVLRLLSGRQTLQEKR